MPLVESRKSYCGQQYLNKNLKNWSSHLRRIGTQYSQMERINRTASPTPNPHPKESIHKSFNLMKNHQYCSVNVNYKYVIVLIDSGEKL